MRRRKRGEDEREKERNASISSRSRNEIDVKSSVPSWKKIREIRRRNLEFIVFFTSFDEIRSDFQILYSYSRIFLIFRIFLLRWNTTLSCNFLPFFHTVKLTNTDQFSLLFTVLSRVEILYY